MGNVEFLARSRDTPRFNLSLITIQPHRDGPEPHTHAAEDDSFYMLEGELTFLLDEEEIVKLAPEAKHLTDTIKMVAYRAETGLVRLLAPHYARTEDEGRALIREMLASSADIIPDLATKRLRVRVHALANPRSNAALATLCGTLNALDVQYPGTDLTLAYEAPGVA